MRLYEGLLRRVEMFKFMICFYLVGVYMMMCLYFTMHHQATALKWGIYENGRPLEVQIITNDQLGKFWGTHHGDTSKFQEEIKKIMRERWG